VGAVPVLVDINEQTLCISADAAEAALTERTAAIMVVHLFCSAADLDRFGALSRSRGIPLLEDCSQAHGAIWRGRRVGSFGTLAAFSFQQTKLLTSGEGGAALTDDAQLARRMEELRADGRRYVAQPRIGQLDLEEVGAVQGRNYCLSEFHAALLVEGLDRLDEENAVRRGNANLLRAHLDGIDGVEIIDQPPQLEEPTYYHLCLRFEPEQFGVASVDPIAEALTAELGVHVEPVDRPLNDNPLYDPRRSSRSDPRDHGALDPTQFGLPAATEARRTCLTLPHRVLLGDALDTESIVQAIEKVQAHIRSGGQMPIALESS
jgi:L-glutamine:scyllo-inosose aminotransferase/L-glutamine:2-deoxy-scyllo-inosose/3-amino-2,3-dideoxy-scyllo-inosose aminotransferase